MNEFLDVVKNIMIIACLCATFCSTCRQEQANDRMAAEISALQKVSNCLYECSFQPKEAE